MTAIDDAIEEAALDLRATHRSDNRNWQPECVTCQKAWPCDAEMLAELVLTRRELRAQQSPPECPPSPAGTGALDASG
jgi:hypothetical protein